jgi:CRP-like cAMP-binding protein
MGKGVALSGNLSFLSLGELLQIIGNNGGSGVLQIISKYAPHPGVIYVDKGDPVDASNGSQNGTDALFSLFGWTEGEFSFSEENIDRKNVINKNRMEIILDGSRMVDDGKIEKLGPVSFKKVAKDGAGKEKTLPVIKGPFVDYMYVVDEEEFFEGTEIVTEGNYGNWMYVVLEGQVEISKDSDKGPIKILRLSDGAYVGSIASFLSEDTVRNTTVTAVGRVQLGMLDSQRLANEFAAMTAEMRGVVKSLDNRLKKITDNVARIHTESNGMGKILQGKKAVIEQGKSEERVFTITSGSATIVRKTDAGHVPLVELAPGDFFGHLPFMKMGHEPHSASVFASTDLKIAPLDPDRLIKEHENISSSFRNITEHLAICTSVTTMIACEAYRMASKKSAKKK